MQSETKTRPRVRCDHVARAACDVFGVTPTEMTCARRVGLFLRAREAYTWVSRELVGETYDHIARTIKRGTHSTALLRMKKAEYRIACNAEFAMQVDCVADRAVAIAEQERKATQ
jgi:chromosomal replication initiation ATPase DnaA